MKAENIDQPKLSKSERLAQWRKEMGELTRKRRDLLLSNEVDPLSDSVAEDFLRSEPSEDDMRAMLAVLSRLKEKIDFDARDYLPDGNEKERAEMRDLMEEYHERSVQINALYAKHGLEPKMGDSWTSMMASRRMSKKDLVSLRRARSRQIELSKDIANLRDTQRSIDRLMDEHRENDERIDELYKKHGFDRVDDGKLGSMMLTSRLSKEEYAMLNQLLERQAELATQVGRLRRGTTR